MLISFVVPIYKSEKTIVKTIEDRINSLKKVQAKHNFDYEIICVIDGILDNSKDILLEKNFDRVKVFGYQKNQGKGFAIRYGFERANGDLIGFIDDGSNFDADVICNLADALVQNPEIDTAVASKKHPESKLVYPLKRRIFTWGYSLVTRIATGIKYKDTQVGAKLFRQELVEKVIPRLLVKRFAIDVEILAVANFLGYNKHIDVPVTIDFNTDKSSAATFKSMKQMLQDTLAVGYRLRVRNWYHDNNSAMWSSFENDNIEAVAGKDQYHMMSAS